MLCEGQTEAAILKPFLRPYWEKRFATVEVLHYNGNGELKAKFKKDAEQQLRTEADSSVLCLVDLYHEPFGIYHPDTMTVAEGFQQVQSFMMSQIEARRQHRFGAFPVVMEIETWLLADRYVQRQLSRLIAEPETIPHPTAYLQALYQAESRYYNKVVDGRSLFGRAHATEVYDDNCPHFNLLVD